MPILRCIHVETKRPNIGVVTVGTGDGCTGSGGSAPTVVPPWTRSSQRDVRRSSAGHGQRFPSIQTQRRQLERSQRFLPPTHVSYTRHYPVLLSLPFWFQPSSTVEEIRAPSFVPCCTDPRRGSSVRIHARNEFLDGKRRCSCIVCEVGWHLDANSERASPTRSRRWRTLRRL